MNVRFRRHVSRRGQPEICAHFVISWRAMIAGLSLLWFVLGLTLRPYVPPLLEPEPAYVPSAVRIVEILPENGGWDANVFARPIYTAPLVGNVARGSRIRVAGELKPRDGAYCSGGVYYAIAPFGWICAADTKPTTLAATTESVVALIPETPLPYRYVMVVVDEGEFLPMWGSIEQLWAYADPERQLGRGDSVALTASGSTLEFEGEQYYLSVDGKVLPVKGTTTLRNYSEWQGVEIPRGTHLPFAWVTPQKAGVFDAPKGTKIEDLPRRTRVDVFEDAEPVAGWLRIGDGRYMKADQLNEVRKIERPLETGQHAQWVDVDLGEQVVIAYRDGEPVFATLTSSGRPPNSTPRGNYPVWGKAAAITMKSQSYDDSPYYVNRVPWVMFFQAHNALHGAYWHDRFGAVKSHGCANLAPRDARYLFEWMEPKLPPGWTAVRYWNLNQAPVVHVRNSKQTKPFKQERNIGPPDKEDEAERLEKAISRREAEERAEEARLLQQAEAMRMVAPAMPTPLLGPRAPERLPAPLLR
jgi:hypothetical protein